MPPTAPDPLTKTTDCRHGRMIHLRTDLYIGPSLEHYGEFCEGEAMVFAQLLSPGEVVVDAGANIGAHTLVFSKLAGPAGRVYAFEPQRVIFQILCANIVLNEAFNIHTFQAGLGAASAVMKLPGIDYHHPGSNFGAVSPLGITEGDDIPIIPLDSIALPSLRLIKIDVEGMEDQVLLGARAQILRHRPLLYVENDRREHSPRLISLIDSLGYDMWWHKPRLFNPDNYAKNPENIFGKIVTVNMICIPKEKNSAITGFRKVSGPEDW